MGNINEERDKGRNGELREVKIVQGNQVRKRT